MKSRFSHYKSLWSTGKATNAFKNISSFYLSRISGKYLVWGKPFSFFIEPTNLCNLRCTECPVGLQTLERPQGYMPLEQYRNIIDDISGHTWHLLLYFQGEPAMHPDITKMINYAHQKKIFTEMSTNGTRLASRSFAAELAASSLGKLIISLDGASETTYQFYRQKGLFSRVIKGIRQVVAERNQLKKKFPRIVIQFLVMRHNEHEIAAVKNLGKQLGVDKVIFKSPQIYDFENAEEILPRNTRFRRYKKMNGEYKLKGSYSGYCKKLWIGSVITQQSTVIPCCFDKDAHFPIGNLSSHKFKEIWENPNYQRFRKNVISNRSGIPMCRNCSEGLRTFF